MAEDFVNQLTLNFLISKHQLQKLNKKVKENNENTRKTDKEVYGKRIIQLFNDLLVNEPPVTLLQEVKTGFDFFIEKCIYYFKALDNNEILEKERTDDYPSNNIIYDDIDFEKEEQTIERGNYKEKSKKYDEEDEEEEENDEDEENDDQEEENDEDQENDDQEEENDEDDEKEEEEKKEEEEEEINKKIETHQPVIVKHKYKTKTNSVGVDDIQKLPLDWFQNVRENYKKNQIIPRKKDIIFEEQTFRDLKKKI